MNVKEERNLIFNPGYTHVGISCGCHSSEVEMCCFQFAKNPYEKIGVQYRDLMMVDPATCPESRALSKDLLGIGELEDFYN